MSICEECLGKLHISYDFIHQCKNSDASLKKILNISTQPNSSSKSEESLTFYENISLQTDSNFDQIDLSKIIEQRHVFIDKYLKKDSLPKEEGDDEMLTLINNRKDFKSFNLINETDFIKTENEVIDINDYYLCSNCDKVFDSEESLSEHKNSCLISTSENTKVKSAVKNNTNKRNKSTFNCDLCNKSFANAPKLALHFYNHAKTFEQEKKTCVVEENEVQQCHLCLDRIEAESLEAHLKSHDKSSHNCEFCSKEYFNESNLITHLLKKHGIQAPFCHICSKRFDNQTSLRLHKKMHVAEKIKSVFTCPICEEKFSSTYLLKEHSLKHLSESYKCEKCVRTFNNVVSYKHHLKLHYEPKHLCSVCGKAYFTRVTLQCHLRSHTNEKPYSCTVCNKAFSSRSTLSVHRRIHSDLKAYVCMYCGYSCRQSGDLAMHIRTHTGDKPYKCTFPNCSRKFTTCSQRREHYRRHTNERNHICKDCGKAFLESKTLKVHMLTHSGEKPHSCHTCGKKFRRIHHLTYHLKSHAINSTSTITNNDVNDKNNSKNETFHPLTMEWNEPNDKIIVSTDANDIIETHII